MTFEEVNDFVAPRPDVVESVKEWIRRYTKSTIESTPNSDILRVTVPVATAQRMLDTEYQEFLSDAGHIATRTLEYSLPDEIAPLIDFVAPTVRFPKIKRTPKNEKLKFAPAISPDYLKNLYEVGSYRSTSPLNSQLVTGYLEE